ncbi:MAG: hypothetical protein EOP04_04340 [Proteobacteria bacterium]|nr:MAG: hypothetical protein EOP04_04340 [Pseudomonadota bacterium]
MNEFQKLLDIYFLHFLNDAGDFESILAEVENCGTVLDFWEYLKDEPPLSQALFAMRLIKFRPEIRPVVEALAVHEDPQVRHLSLTSLTYLKENKGRRF